ncbi:hypothetical protein LP419_13740 [Massilia sp. H-1]|nr:hypothetical protein LP419_13740 [Massilia sp. H-1]
MLAMSRVWRSPDHKASMIAAKGAPESVIDLCHLDSATSELIARQVACMAAEGLRVLGVVRAVFDAAQLPVNQHDFAFEFLGLVALEDPVRPDVPAGNRHLPKGGHAGGDDHGRPSRNRHGHRQAGRDRAR